MRLQESSQKPRTKPISLKKGTVDKINGKRTSDNIIILAEEFTETSYQTNLFKKKKKGTVDKINGKRTSDNI
jgi:hypothetical protein